MRFIPKIKLLYNILFHHIIYIKLRQIIIYINI